MIALAALTGEHHVLQAGELGVLRSVPADSWSTTDGRNRPAIDSLTRKALLISDADDPELAAVRHRDEALSASEWDLYAVLFHYMTQWTSLDIRDSGEDESQLSMAPRRHRSRRPARANRCGCRARRATARCIERSPPAGPPGCSTRAPR